MRMVLIAGLLFLPAAAFAQFEKLPKVAQDAIAERKKECEEVAAIKPGFVTEKDINSDGVADYILDYGYLPCVEFESRFCGTGGCVTQVFASLPKGGYVKALDMQVRQIEFKTVRKRPAIVLDLHGGRCGGFGPDPCPRTLVWNGKTFKRTK